MDCPRSTAARGLEDQADVVLEDFGHFGGCDDQDLAPAGPPAVDFVGVPAHRARGAAGEPEHDDQRRLGIISRGVGFGFALLAQSMRTQQQERACLMSTIARQVES